MIQRIRESVLDIMQDQEQGRIYRKVIETSTETWDPTLYRNHVFKILSLQNRYQFENFIDYLFSMNSKKKERRKIR